jgi:hypothetical protein
MRLRAFWDIAPCSLIIVDLTFQRCILPPSSGWSSPCTSEMLVYSNENTWNYIPEGSHLHTRCHGTWNLTIYFIFNYIYYINWFMKWSTCWNQYTPYLLLSCIIIMTKWILVQLVTIVIECTNHCFCLACHKLVLGYYVFNLDLC